MKRFLCLALVMALTAMALTGCSRRRKAEDTASADTAATAAAGNFAPDNGPGYSITDGSSLSQADGVGDDQPTPEPIETLPPEDIELEKRKASMAGIDEGSGGTPMDVPVEGAAGDEANADSTFDAEAAGTGSDDIVLGTYDETTDTATHAPPSIIDTSAYQFSAVMDENVDFTFNYPSHWDNVPGIFTICFREPVEDGDFPARIAITRKRLVHTPDDAALMDQLVSYMKSIGKQYDKATFQTSTPNTNDTFMGTRAFSNTYLAYWGDIEIKGYVIGCAIERTMYVLHFCASYGDYLSLQNVLKYMVQSARQRSPEGKK